MAQPKAVSTITVRTPARLHFGLLGLGNTPGRQYGGFGLMIERPGVELRMTPASSWEAVGLHSKRALATAISIAGRFADRIGPPTPTKIEVTSSPAEHVGLGVGTQLSLAIAAGLLQTWGEDHRSPELLANLTDRGRRSGIGLHGFLNGGFLVDGGRAPGSKFPTMIVRYDFPEDWRVLIATPKVSSGMHGIGEHKAFESLGSVSEGDTNYLCRLVLLGVLPAIIEKRIESFGMALQEVQRVVGKNFAPVQGGAFASPEAGNIAGRLSELGLVGVGQSSWGPTIYGFSDGSDEELALVREELEGSFPLSRLDCRWTKVSVCGATLSRTDS